MASKSYQFKPASLTRIGLKMALISPSGCGKTLTSLMIAKGFDCKVAVIDTEHGSAALYRNEPCLEGLQYDTLELDDFHPDEYIAAIHAAENGEYDFLIIDSMSHGWGGQGGVLELVDRISGSQTKENRFTAWGQATPVQNRFLEAITRSPLHIICTIRSKTGYILEMNNKGKQVPKKVGLQPIQRDGVEYEFGIIGEMDHDHMLNITKTRFSALDGVSVYKPSCEFGRQIRDIISGVAPVARPTQERKERLATSKELLAALNEMKDVACTKLGCDSRAVLSELCNVFGVNHWAELTPQQVRQRAADRYQGQLSMVIDIGTKDSVWIDEAAKKYGCLGDIPWEELCKRAETLCLFNEEEPPADGHKAANDLYGTDTGLVGVPREQDTPDDDAPPYREDYGSSTGESNDIPF